MIRHSSKEKTLLRRVGVPEDIKFRMVCFLALLLFSFLFFAPRESNSSFQVKKGLNRHLKDNLIKLDDRDTRFQTHLTVGLIQTPCPMIFSLINHPQQRCFVQRQGAK